MAKDMVVDTNVEAKVAAAKDAKAKTPADIEKFKQQKKEAAERFKERKAAEAEAAMKNAKEYTDFIKKNGMYDKLPENLKAYVDSLTAPKKSVSANGGLFNTLFGAAPKVGDKITLKDIFDKTLKGKTAIDFYVKKRWAEKGIVIEYVQKQPQIMSEYVIKSLGK